MVGEKTTRRRFLVAAIAGSGSLASGFGLSMIRASSAWAQATPDQTPGLAETLGRMAQLLYPHDAIADDVYAEVVDGILSAVANDATISGALDAAVSALNAVQAADWFDLEEEQQIAAMTKVQGEAFFAAIQDQVMGRFYGHPKVREFIKYPGSSVEFGGYVNRGFDDIDWLPEQA